MMLPQTTSAAKTQQNRRRRREKLTELAFLSPSLIGVCVFFVLPFAIIIYYSMISNPISREFVFFDNYISLFKNSAFRTAAKNTLTFSAMALPLAVILPLGMALLLDERVPLHSVWRTFLLSPMTVPIASVVLIWQVLFHFNGAVNEWMALLGVDKIDWLKSQYNQIVLLLLFLWKNIGYNMILFMAALGSVPGAQLEAAMLDGAGKWGRFFRIKLRYITPTIFFTAILSLINSFKVFREAYMLAGDYPYGGLYMLQHFMNNTLGSLDYQKLSAAAMIMALVMVAIVGVLYVLEDRLGRDLEGA